MDAEPVAYLAWRDGNPCYEGDDAVCEDAVWPVDHDDDRISMPVYLHPAHDDTALLKQCLDALTCSDTADDPGHRCGHCDDYVDRNGTLRTALRERLETK